MEFSERMQALLGDEYEQFLQYYNGDNFRGLRVNTLKCTAQQLQAALSCSLQPTPFCPDGYYLPEELTGNHPLHHAGAFYMQEPSATSAVEMLGVQPGEQVLDLCAAPGGKSTQIAAKLQGKGLLWSNEIVKSRANILLSNIERMGVRNAVVSNCHPETLCAAMSGQFDRVLVDAPCSGEGMFRKNSDAKTEWSAEHVRSCAERQLHILNSAKTALKPGGVLVYSTCTFSREENESVIAPKILRGASSRWTAARVILPQDCAKRATVCRRLRRFPVPRRTKRCSAFMIPSFADGRSASGSPSSTTKSSFFPRIIIPSKGCLSCVPV